MNNKPIRNRITTAIIALILIVAAAYFLLNNKQEPTVKLTAEVPVQEENISDEEKTIALVEIYRSVLKEQAQSFVKNLLALPENENSFESFIWETPYYKVKELFPHHIIYDDTIWAPAKIGYLKVAYRFYFVDLKLHGVSAILLSDSRGSHTAKNQFEYIREKIDALGMPGHPPRKIWHNTLLLDSEEDWGIAFMLGHFEYEKKWETHHTAIKMHLFVEEYDESNLVTLIINFLNPAWVKEIESQMPPLFQRFNP